MAILAPLAGRGTRSRSRLTRTEEGGELALGDPLEESGRPVYGTSGGTDDGDIEPASHLNATTEGSGTGED